MHSRNAAETCHGATCMPATSPKYRQLADTISLLLLGAFIGFALGAHYAGSRYVEHLYDDVECVRRGGEFCVEATGGTTSRSVRMR